VQSWLDLSSVARSPQVADSHLMQVVVLSVGLDARVTEWNNVCESISGLKVEDTKAGHPQIQPRSVSSADLQVG
jgi:hypothetical protein